MHAERLQLMVTHRRKSDLSIRQYSDLRSVRGVHAISGDTVDDYLFDVGDILHPEQRQLVR